jgi:hypothetical protein
MATVKEVIDAFERRDFDKVEQFLQNIAANRTGNGIVVNPEMIETKQTKIDTAFPWLYDIGVGPITAGLGALQVMSDVIAGASWSAYKIFNTYNVVYTPNELKNADDRFALIIILENLGMLDYYNIAKDVNSKESDKLKNLCLTIHKRIKAGAFVKADFEQQMLIACKSVIRVTINHRQVI